MGEEGVPSRDLPESVTQFSHPENRTRDLPVEKGACISRWFHSAAK